MYLEIPMKHFYVNFIILVVFFVFYLSFMYGYDVPDFDGEVCGRGNLSESCNFSGYLDR